MKKCTFCKGYTKQGFTTFTVNLEHSVIIIRNVPAQLCTQCGEAYYSTDVMKQLYEIATSMKNTLTEVAIVNYAPAA